MNWPRLLNPFCLRGDLKQYQNYKYFLTPRCLWLDQCPGRFVLENLRQLSPSRPWTPGWELRISNSWAGSIPSSFVTLGRCFFPLCISFTPLTLCLFPKSQSDLGRDLQVQLIPNPKMLPGQSLRIWLQWEN